MQVCLLGAAAGGGFPQWNCACPNCRGLRSGTAPARPRTQSCVAVSADGQRWFLLNASPDVRLQVESFPPLAPQGAVRSTAVQAVLLTGADLDHTLGLLLLREGGRLAVHATASVRRALNEGLRLQRVLESYGGIDWYEPPWELAPLGCVDGRPSGLSYAAFPVPGRPPRYREDLAPSLGDCIGYRLVDSNSGGRLIVIPGAAALDAGVMSQLQDCDALLLDGTFWSEDELPALGIGDRLATDMGHLPVGGPGGSLARIAALPARHKVYMHVNNTNPMLREDSPQRRAVDAAGAEVGWDGMQFTL